jgi:hypothetical protein
MSQVLTLVSLLSGFAFSSSTLFRSHLRCHLLKKPLPTSLSKLSSLIYFGHFYVFVNWRFFPVKGLVCLFFEGRAVVRQNLTV